jgi:hypothetical protein
VSVTITDLMGCNADVEQIYWRVDANQQNHGIRSCKEQREEQVIKIMVRGDIFISIWLVQAIFRLPDRLDFPSSFRKRKLFLIQQINSAFQAILNSI